MIDLVVRGGTVVTPSGAGALDVAVEGEKIVSITEPGALNAEGARVIDATGKIVVPGGIEPHAHVATPIFGQPDAETAPPDQTRVGRVRPAVKEARVEHAVDAPGEAPFEEAHVGVGQAGREVGAFGKPLLAFARLDDTGDLVPPLGGRVGNEEVAGEVFDVDMAVRRDDVVAHRTPSPQP